MNETSFKMQIWYDAKKLCTLQRYMKDESALRAGVESLLDALYQSQVPAEVREAVDRRNAAQTVERRETLGQFVREHPDDVVRVMSPNGYVTISPDQPPDKLFAHAGVSGTETPIAWEELKDQVVENLHYDPAGRNWRLLTDCPSQDSQAQAPGMRPQM